MQGLKPDSIDASKLQAPTDTSQILDLLASLDATRQAYHTNSTAGIESGLA